MSWNEYFDSFVFFFWGGGWGGLGVWGGGSEGDLGFIFPCCFLNGTDLTTGKYFLIFSRGRNKQREVLSREVVS